MSEQAAPAAHTTQAQHRTEIRTSRSGLSHHARCKDCGTNAPWRCAYEYAWNDATRHELMNTELSDRSYDDREMLTHLGRYDLLDPNRERRVKPTVATTPGLDEAQRSALSEYRRAEARYEETPLDEFPSGPGQKGSLLHTRRVNRLSRASTAMVDLEIGHLR